MEQAQLFYRFGVALIIGVLIGLEREHAATDDDQQFAGIRTFALLSLLGCTAAAVAEILASPAIFVSFALITGVLIAVAYFVGAWRGELGLTTETAAMLALLLGGLCYWERIELAAALAVAMMLLLSLKVEMHRFADRITREDVYATLKFAVISAIILPVLPREPLWPQPFDVLIPYNIWLMVVFISGISFLGYILLKLVGARQGIGLAGFLGGLVSSTAVTLSFAERSHEQASLVKAFALAIIVSWTTMFGRVLIEVAALNLELLKSLWLPISAAATAGLLYSLYLYRTQQSQKTNEVPIANPFELQSAVKFGLLYGVVLVVAKTAQMYLGSTGIYLSSIASGLADVDAITLSLARLSATPGGIALETAERAIVLAVISNTVVKGSIVLLSGPRRLSKAILPGFLLILVTGLTLAFLF